jgi:plastocyanin
VPAPINHARTYRHRCGAVLFLALALLGPGQALYAKAPRVHTVLIDGMQFVPRTVEAHVGDTIVWKNKDPFPHTATAVNRSFDSKDIAQNRSWKFKVRRTGAFPYLCTLHPTMTGSLVVK